ncbi:unannotated protein [freshwater metagenome]|uniref:Unannotated protein n=1 Tax=freshwater metagenome TaxID=449393 RepID=A0A6J7ITB5_9ZZZZ|nr:hypothetical protein [Actinomycetota bacterium]
MSISITTEEAAARLALRALADEYAWRTDEYDYDGYAELFTPDAELSSVNPGETEPFFLAKGTEELRGVVHGNDQFARTFHAVENHRIHHLDLEAGTASGVIYCTAHHLIEREGEVPQTLIMLIRYHDEYALTSDGWKFTNRCLRMQWVEYFDEADVSPYPFRRGSADWMDA